MLSCEEELAEHSRSRMEERSDHQLASHDTLGETREVLNLGGGSQLTSSSNTVGHEALVQYGYPFISPYSVVTRGRKDSRFNSARAK